MVPRHEQALAGFFGEVLTVCAETGLATVGVIAIDGIQIAASANRDRTLDYRQITRAMDFRRLGGHG